MMIPIVHTPVTVPHYFYLHKANASKMLRTHVTYGFCIGYCGTGTVVAVNTNMIATELALVRSVGD